METILSAYTDLVADRVLLADEDAIKARDFGAAIVIQLERDNGGDFHIDVFLRQLEGSQLAFVLGVARKYELEAREESGYLRLSRHLTMADVEKDDRESEEVAT